jgi:hypothetical protein
MDRPKSRLFGFGLFKKGREKKKSPEEETTDAGSVENTTSDSTRSLWNKPFQIRLLIPCRS